jgi:DNA-binding transcriptional ArsR family regulator
LSAETIASLFSVTRSAISQYRRILIAAGLVTDRKERIRRMYNARPEGLAELKSFLEMFWDARLLALAREAEAEERRVQQ